MKDDSMEVVRGFDLPFGMVPREVALDGAIPAAPFRLYVVLAAYADRAGRAHPSKRTLQEDSGLSRATVTRALGELEGMGLLARTPGTGRARSRYVLGARRGGSPTSPPDESRGLTHDPAGGSPTSPPSGTDQSTDQGPPVVPRDRPRVLVARRVVTEAEHAKADEVLRLLDLHLKPRRPFRRETHLARIVGRLRSYPDLTVEDHERVISRAAADPWWDGPGTPNVIYGNDSIFERMVLAADSPAVVRSGGEVTAEDLRRMADEAEGVREEGDEDEPGGLFPVVLGVEPTPGPGYDPVYDGR